ncbi:zinc finger protein 431-like [Mesocricetus auratus]|uniref:Zinc finger protein 431-like n=1 Tax=Mesocricetus auratus TaxID=10036 RepID=A0ABM2X905_MESAU|nr:zinc finger protein 431-like [Mesocricetus auratus]
MLQEEQLLRVNTFLMSMSWINLEAVGFAESFPENLYKDVILETFSNLSATGDKWKDHNIEEPCDSYRRNTRHLQRHENIHTGKKPYEGDRVNETNVVKPL